MGACIVKRYRPYISVFAIRLLRQQDLTQSEVAYNIGHVEDPTRNEQVDSWLLLNARIRVPSDVGTAQLGSTKLAP